MAFFQPSAQHDLSVPAFECEAITASATPLTYTTRGIYVGTTGNVTITTPYGTEVTFANVVAGTILPVAATIISAGTNIVALY